MAKKTPTIGNGAEGPLKILKSVYDFMTQNGLDSVEIIEDGAAVKLVRRKANLTPVPVPVPTPMGAPVASAVPVQYASVHQTAATSSASPGAPPPSGTAVKSPMMGIFYRAPSPSSPPFCKEGEVVKPGHVICMIEAMKVFNEIKAEYPCTIVKYLVENGKPVKSGQDLIIVAR